MISTNNHLFSQPLILNKTKRITTAYCHRLRVTMAMNNDWISSPSASPYEVLGVKKNSCSPAQLKAAFRARVKEFHPDVCTQIKDADSLIKRVIEAYEILSRNHPLETSQSTVSTDPFEEPECEAYHVFVNRIQCIGKGCPYSCVKRSPDVFSFSLEDGRAQVISQEHGEDYHVQLAVGQCPQKCIHFVTPSQQAILEDLLNSVMSMPYDMAESYMLDSLLAKAKFENNRFRKPKRNVVSSTDFVDWM